MLVYAKLCFLHIMRHCCFPRVINPAFSDHSHVFINIYLSQMMFLRYLMSGFTCFGNKQEFYCFWRFRSRFAVICCDFPFIVIWKNSEHGSANIFNQMGCWFINLQLQIVVSIQLLIPI